MDRGEYYERMRRLAQEKRQAYQVATADIRLSTLRQIYKREGIRLDLWPGPLKKVKAAYFWEDGEASVLVRRSLPEVPRIFAQVHELKHHFEDRDRFALSCCDITARSPAIEIGAEEFAAEFIYPLDEFIMLLEQLGIQQGSCSPEDVVDFRRACPARVSYTFVCKRLERLGIIAHGQFVGVKFQLREEQLYGTPIYRRKGRTN